MLAGTVYFYDKDNLLIKKLDVEAYDNLGQEAFLELIDKICAEKVTLVAYHHHHHSGKISILYEKNKKQT